MNRRSISGIVSMIAPIVFAVMWALSAFTDGKWILFSDTLSYLGISDNAVSAALFNWGCIIMGALMIISSTLLIRTKDDLDDVFAVLIIVAGLFLAGVGVFDLDTGFPHNFSSGVFAVATFLAMVIFIYRDWKETKVYAYITISLMLISGIVLLIYLIFDTVPGFSQAVVIMSALVWSFVCGIKSFVNS